MTWVLDVPALIVILGPVDYVGRSEHTYPNHPTDCLGPCGPHANLDHDMGRFVNPSKTSKTYFITGELC